MSADRPLQHTHPTRGTRLPALLLRCKRSYVWYPRLIPRRAWTNHASDSEAKFISSHTRHDTDMGDRHSPLKLTTPGKVHRSSYPGHCIFGTGWMHTRSALSSLWLILRPFFRRSATARGRPQSNPQTCISGQSGATCACLLGLMLPCKPLWWSSPMQKLKNRSSASLVIAQNNIQNKNRYCPSELSISHYPTGGALWHSSTEC